MKKNNIIKTLSAACAAGVVLLCSAPAQAGPGIQQTFVPVKTMQEAAALKPGTQIAITCPTCGAVSVVKVDKKHSHMSGFDCPACKHSFEFKNSGSGKPTAFVVTDKATGKKMPMKMAAAMH